MSVFNRFERHSLGLKSLLLIVLKSQLRLEQYRYNNCTYQSVCEIGKYFFWGSLIISRGEPTTPPQGEYFVIYEVGHAKFYQFTKFEVSNYTCSKCTKWVPKFTNLARTHYPVAPLGYFVIKQIGHVQDIYVPHIKFLATPVPN